MVIKDPTNADLLREIKDVKAVQHDQTNLLRQHSSDISELKAWRIATEAAKQAIENYKQYHQSDRQSGTFALNRELLRAVVVLVGALAVVAYMYVTLRK